MCSFYEIMSFQLENEVSELQSSSSNEIQSDASMTTLASKTQASCDYIGKFGFSGQIATSLTVNEDLSTSTSHTDAMTVEGVDDPHSTVRNESGAASSSGSPWYQLRKDATTFVSQNLRRGRNNFWQLITSCSPKGDNQPNGLSSEDHRVIGNHHDYKLSPITSDKASNGHFASEEEREDLLAHFIYKDTQLPSRISKHNLPKNGSKLNEEESTVQTGSSVCILRSMDKYARLMQKLEIVNVEFFKGICQLFEIYFHFVFQTFCQNTANLSGKGINDSPNNILKTALSRIAQDCDQWIKLQIVSLSSSSPTSLNDVTPTGPNMSVLSAASLDLKAYYLPETEYVH